MAETKSSQSCSVPFCSNSKKKQPYLSFHSFPSDESIKRRWLCAIRRDEGVEFTVRKGSSFVCAMHFTEDEVRVHPQSGRKFLTPQAVPSRFSWNNWGEVKSHQTRTAESTVCYKQEEEPVEMECVDVALPGQEHDYNSRPPPGALDEALEKIKELEELVASLTISRALLDRWCVSDEDFKYFTRFPNKNIFFVFWRSVEPSASNIEYWSKAEKIGNSTAEKEVVIPSPKRKMQLIDEFFMFCLCVAVGLKERVLAEIFQVSTSTVNRIVITWSNYLSFVLGSIQIWMTKEQVRWTMPVKFQRDCPNVRVIIDCTELRCECPEAITLHSETFSAYKPHTTFKGLIGVAPCGAITFISKLFASSISNKELTKQSGILGLLEPGDEVIADKGFLIQKLLEDVKAKLIIPPFKHCDQFSSAETERIQAIASLSILVERAIRRVKEYHIWDSPVPLTLADTVNQMWSCCCMMANYQGPLDLKILER
ncbi:uncharacterized protein [Danio rerio]|uniref:THAP-type domain-containing protein n=1 Tax=Danio rerio TaxID=7955 RepID=A0A8M9Q9T1_DANRE|nr:uncharacterized protein LOC101882464 [Danio rerio]XP_021332321.1 uncharacterized protein LOC101882464 [Danio rerio]|eukprot:XP_005172048.2 uncharacterized protein LOC101882464 [Danio rerio]